MTTYDMERYAEADRGRFDAWLLRDEVAIAYTDGDDVVKITPEFVYEMDFNAVCDFADKYGLPIDINVWA